MSTSVEMQPTMASLEDSSKNTCRFVPVTNTDKEVLLQTAMPHNTIKRNKWAMKIFSTWREWQKATWAVNGGDCIVLKDYDEMLPIDLDYVLQDFLVSVRKETKEEYPPASLRSIMCGIISHFKHHYNRQWDFFKDKEFSKSRSLLDARMRQLTRRGIGSNKRKAFAISYEMEESMWTDGLLGDDNPKKLVDTVLYLLGIHFALRSRDEHRSLRYGTNIAN